MACDQIVMHPEAVLGGPGSPQMSRNEIEVGRADDPQPVARGRKLRSWSLWAAMIDPASRGLSLHAGWATWSSSARRNARRPQPKPDAGGKQPPWLARRPMRDHARRWPSASAASRRSISTSPTTRWKTLPSSSNATNLEDDPTLVEPGWADMLVDYLRSPGISALLLIIGGVALYMELHAPGLGLGGFVSAVCFLLFFWSHYLPSTAFWLEITLVPRRSRLPADGGLRGAGRGDLRPRRQRHGAGFPGPGQPDLRCAAQQLRVRPIAALRC